MNHECIVLIEMVHEYECRESILQSNQSINQASKQANEANELKSNELKEGQEDKTRQYLKCIWFDCIAFWKTFI